MRLLFVCTGNICRSPIAERLATAYAARLQLADFRASSAGTRAVIAHPIHDDAVTVLEKLGGDPASFGARQLTSRIALEADLVLTMTKAHREQVLERAPRQLNRTFTLSEVARLVTEFDAQKVGDLSALRSHLSADEVADIADPIGRTPDFFAAVGSQIADLLPPIIELCQRSSLP